MTTLIIRIEVDDDPTLADPQHHADELLYPAELDAKAGNIDPVYDFDSFTAEWAEGGDR